MEGPEKSSEAERTGDSSMQLHTLAFVTNPAGDPGGRGFDE